MKKNAPVPTTEPTKSKNFPRKFKDGFLKFFSKLKRLIPRIRVWHIVVYVIILWAAKQGVLDDYPALCQVAEINLRFWNWAFSIALDILNWIVGVIDAIPFIPSTFVDWLKTIIG